MRATAGLPASSWITFPSPAVIAISGPIGRAPCDTHAATRTPDSAGGDGAVGPEQGSAIVARARQAADDREPGVAIRNRREQRLDGERERIHEQDERVGAVEVRHTGDRERAAARLARLERER